MPCLTDSCLLRRGKGCVYCTSFKSVFSKFTQFTFYNLYAMNYIHVKSCTFKRIFFESIWNCNFALNTGINIMYITSPNYFSRSLDIKIAAYGCFSKPTVKLHKFSTSSLTPEHDLRVRICSQSHNALSPQTLQSRKTVQVQNCQTENQKIYTYIDRLHIKINILLHDSSAPFKVREHQPLLIECYSSLWCPSFDAYYTTTYPSVCSFLLLFEE